MKDATSGKTFQCVTAIAALALLAPVATLAAEPSEYIWDGALAHGATVEVVNPTGDVFVQRSESGRVELHALRSSNGSDPSTVELRTVRTDAGLAICSEAPAATFECVAGAKPPAATSNYRVDELVRVPAGTTVVIRARNGKIVIENGQSAGTASGEIRAMIVAGGNPNALVFQARDGSITPA
jgi:hypothetical protein